MITTRTRYIVYNHAGSGVRHHHFATQNDIIMEADGLASAGDTITALGFPFQVYDGHSLPFAFMSVHGASDGNHLYTSAGNQPISVGNANIDILVVYAPLSGIGGDGHGGPGVWVDAFNVDTGDFSDALDFIEVLTPPTPPTVVDAAKTTDANVEGVVSTSSAENLRAAAIIDGGIPFLEWKRIVPMETVVPNAEIDLAANETGEIWLAFYQKVAPKFSIPDLHRRIANTMAGWVKDDYCGTPYPHKIGPHGPVFALSLPEAVLHALPAAQRERLTTISKTYGDIARTGYAGMAKALEVLGEVGAIVSKAKGGG